MGWRDWNDPEAVVTVRCPAHKNDYDAKTREQLAKELMSLTAQFPNAVTLDVIRDYKMLLDGCRAVEQQGPAQ